MLLLVLGYIEVGRPLPHIANHVVKSIAIRWVCADRRSRLVAIFEQVLPGKLPLPGVRHRLAIWLELIAPGELFVLKTAARSEFPFRLSGKLLACPSRVS